MFDSLNPMTTKTQTESGNALIYVLIAIALFAALNFALSRQSDTSEAGSMPAERAELYATQLISYAGQVKSVLDQMMFTGTDVDEMDFMLPNEDATFNDPPYIHKIYHPEGGGLNPGVLPVEVIDQDNTNPPAGWYLGSFNDVEWSRSTNNDVILTAHQISRQVCANINKKITGSSTIPVFDAALRLSLIDDRFYSGGANAALDTGTACAACDEFLSLCVQDSSTNFYSFYSIVVNN